MEIKDYSQYKKEKEEQALNSYNNDWKARARRILNTVFLVIAAAGLATYFSAITPTDGDPHINGLILIGISCCVKIVELLIRFLG